MVNIKYAMSVSRQARRHGDWQRALQIVSGALCADIESRARLLMERARICNIQEIYLVSLSDSKEAIALEPTNCRGYTHAAIAAHGSFRHEDALIFIHTGLEKVTDHMPLVVRLRILLELEDYKDFVQQICGAGTKAKLQAFIADEENEFSTVHKVLKDNSDEAFAIFRAVALVVSGKLGKAREVVDMAELSHPNRSNLIAAKHFLQNPEALAADVRRDVHFEGDETDSDLDSEDDDLLSEPELEQDSAGEDEDEGGGGGDSDSDVVELGGDEEEDEEPELVGLDEIGGDDDDVGGAGGGGGDQQAGERSDSGLGEDNDLISVEEAMGVSSFHARCKVASKKMMDADYRGAYERYRSAELHVGADIGADAMEFAVFRFCLTYSKLKHQTTDVATVQDCIETFQELSLAFPLRGVCLLGHIGTCEAKKMLNFVKDYQALLDEGKELLESHDFTPVSYPGVDEVIVWSTAQGFKQYLDEWADLVKHQPEYVAKCMHTPCGAIKPEIYVSDLDFKGYVELKCTERCILQFHQSCWKQELKSKANASDTLGAQCWTPDCEGIIVVFKVIDEKNELSIHRSKEEVADKKKSKKQPKSHHQQQLQQKKTEQKKIEEAVKKGKKEKKKGRVGDDHSSDEEKEEPEKHVALEQEAKHAPKAKEDLPQQQPPQSKQQQQQQQQQQAQPAGATAAPNPGEVPWESMKRVKRSDDEDEKKEEQPRGGKKDKKKKRGKQQPAVNPQQLFRIEFTGPKRQLISADGEVLGRDQEEGDQAESASARPANAGSAPSPLPAGFSSGYSAMGGTPPPGRPHEDSKLMHELAVLVKSLMDHMRANGATPLAKLEEFVADCDHEVQVHIADKGGLKAYLSHAIAVEFYDGYVALPGDRDRVKQTFTALWKMNNVFKDHILGSLEEGAEGEDYGNLVRADSPYEEIADEGEDSEEGESDMVARAGKECGAEGNVESAVNAALDEVEQEMLEEQAAAPAVGAAGGEPAADRFDKKLSDEQEDDMFQELLNERLSALGTLKIQLDEAKKERTRFLEQKAAQEQDIKRLEEGSKTKTNELKRVIESYEARAHLNKETAAAYASELLEIQAHVAEIERKLKEAQKNRFFSDGEELTIERARRRLRITRELEDQLRQELDKAEFVRLQAYLLGDIQDGAKDDRESLSKVMCSALVADAKNLVSRVEDLGMVSAFLNLGPARKETLDAELVRSRIRALDVSNRVAKDVNAVDEAVRAGREPDIPRVREEGGHPPLSALLGKLQLKSQNQGSGQQLQQGQYQAGTGPARPLPKTADEFLSFVMPKNTSTQMAPPGLAGAQLQQAAVRPAPADPTIAAFRPFQAANPAPADPTIASMWPVAASTGPAYNVGESGAFGGAALDPIAQLQQQLQAQQQMQALMQLQQQQQQFMQAAGGAGYVAQSVDPTSATLSMAAAKISTLSTAQGVVSPSAASRGQEPQVQASAAGAGAVTGTSKLMDRIVFPLVRETGLAQDIVLGAIMAVKSRRGKLTGLSQEELRATLLDVLVEQGHIRVAGAPPPPAPARPPVVLRPAPVPQASVWNVDGRYSSPVRFTGETITECVICREPLNALQKEKLACGHEYHAVCVKEWFNRKASCPLCNRHVVLESDYPSLK